MPGRDLHSGEVRRFDLVRGQTYRIKLTGAILWGEFTSKLIEATEEELLFENGVRIGGSDMEVYNV